MTTQYQKKKSEAVGAVDLWKSQEQRRMNREFSPIDYQARRMLLQVQAQQVSKRNRGTHVLENEAKSI